jgi:hypothetical protein
MRQTCWATPSRATMTAIIQGKNVCGTTGAVGVKMRTCNHPKTPKNVEFTFYFFSCTSTQMEIL